MNKNEDQFGGIEDPNWAWTSEHQDEMDKYAEGEVNKLASNSTDYNNPFIPKKINPPF